MGKKQARRRHNRRRQQINAAGVPTSATPRLDRARALLAELHAEQAAIAERMPGELADVEPDPTQVADATRVASGQRPSFPPPPWAAQ